MVLLLVDILTLGLAIAIWLAFGGESVLGQFPELLERGFYVVLAV